MLKICILTQKPFWLQTTGSEILIESLTDYSTIQTPLKTKNHNSFKHKELRFLNVIPGGLEPPP
jgi:hypothetical protein